MSRIGRKPITVPAGVTVTLGDANVVTVKGPLGTLTQQFNANMQLSLDAGVLTVARPDDEAANRAAHGLTRTLLENMIVGVSTGYSKTLQIVGVGYRCALQGKNLLLNLGYSHPITVDAPEGITFEVPDTNTIIVKGYDKQVVVRSPLSFVPSVSPSPTMVRVLSTLLRSYAVRQVRPAVRVNNERSVIERWFLEKIVTRLVSRDTRESEHTSPAPLLAPAWLCTVRTLTSVLRSLMMRLARRWSALPPTVRALKAMAATKRLLAR